MEEIIVDKYFLFSVDLEDVRQGVPNGDIYKERVTINTKKYLEWLRLNNFKCTFFTTGQIAKDFPYLIEEIVNEGHEIACHTTSHIPLDKQTPKSFKLDLIENVQLLKNAGAKDIFGFRAPILSLSLVKKTKWAYDVLEDLEFRYSSSVLPAKNPLYGWEEFGTSMKMVNNNILEIPISIGSIGNFSFPISGGIYFRVIPFVISVALFYHIVL